MDPSFNPADAEFGRERRETLPHGRCCNGGLHNHKWSRDILIKKKKLYQHCKKREKDIDSTFRFLMILPVIALLTLSGLRRFPITT